MISEKSTVLAKKIGKNTNIWQYCIVLEGAEIGENVNICSHCFIENNVKIGNNVTVKNGVQIWDEIEIEDDVFIGPNVTFSNDKYPKSKKWPDKYLRTLVQKGASIGAGAVILPGIKIGKGSMVGAGAVVTKNIPDNAIVYGNPAIIRGYTETRKLNNNKKVENSLKPTEEIITKLKRITDIRGKLTVATIWKEIPFEIKRIFLIEGVPTDKIRGEHAHKKCKQFLICISGECSVVLDDGQSRKEISINSSDKGVYIPEMVWGVQYKYSKDAILLVLASEEYDEEDYIRDYQDFIKIIKQ